MPSARTDETEVETVDGTTSEGVDWILAQPLGLAVLIFVVIAFATDRIVTGKAHRREQDRADRLAETVATLAEAVAKATDAAEKSLDATRLVQSLIQGIDSTLRNQRGQ